MREDDPSDGKDPEPDTEAYALKHLFVTTRREVWPPAHRHRATRPSWHSCQSVLQSIHPISR